METIKIKIGALEATRQPVSNNIPPNARATEDTRTNGREQSMPEAVYDVGAAALDGTSTQYPVPDQSPRYGYREDSSPEIVALLHDAQAGNTEAFAELYRQHVERVTRYVAARLRYENRDAIPDVVQDAFCEAFADLPRAHTDVTGWLLAHAAKAFIRFIRSDRKQERAEKSAREYVRREYAHGHEWRRPASDDITAIGHVMLVHAISRLAPNQRRTIQHRYIEGQTQLTTAGLMDKSLTAVKSTEHRALVRLRAELANPEASTTA